MFRVLGLGFRVLPGFSKFCGGPPAPRPPTQHKVFFPKIQGGRFRERPGCALPGGVDLRRYGPGGKGRGAAMKPGPLPVGADRARPCADETVLQVGAGCGSVIGCGRRLPGRGWFVFRVLGLVFAFFRFFEKFCGGPPAPRPPTQHKVFFPKIQGGRFRGRPGLRSARRAVLRGRGRAQGKGRGDGAEAHCRLEMIASDSGGGGLVLRVGAWLRAVVSRGGSFG